MRHAQAEIAPATVFQAEHVVTHYRPTPARFPQLARMQRRKQKLLTDLVHLIANDGNDFVDRALSEKEIGVDAGSKLANIPGADQELVTRDLRVGRRFAQRGDKQVRPAMHVAP